MLNGLIEWTLFVVTCVYFFSPFFFALKRWADIHDLYRYLPQSSPLVTCLRLFLIFYPSYLSKKSFNRLERVGCFSLRNAFASI